MRADGSPSFWRSFFDTYWERTPTILEGDRLHQVLRDACFDAVVAATAQLEHEQSSIRWLDAGRLEHVFSTSDPSMLGALPQASDLDFDRYWSRRGRFGGELFLHVGNLQCYSPEIWFAVREFIAGLYARTGVPARTWCDIYVGRYAATPFGVHIDGASNFMFGLAGTKTIYLWEPEFYERCMRADPRGYEPWLAESIRLDLHAGEIAYWPARFWHIATSSVFSVTANIAFYGHCSARNVIAPALSNLVEDVIVSLADIGPMAITNEYPYRSLRDDVIERLSPARIARAVDHELAKRAVQHFSAMGFSKSLRPRVTAAVTDDDIVVPRAGSRIYVREVPGDDARLLLGAHGNVADIDADARIVELVRQLHTGSPCRVGDLVERFAGEVDSTLLSGETVRELLTLFVDWYALDRRQ